MNKSDLASPRCPGSLKEGFNTYNPATIRKVFNGKSVFHVLEEFHFGANWDDAIITAEDFPGQIWFRMKLIKNRLRPSVEGEYILKTISPFENNLRLPNEQPSNEHLCMQLAGQVFNLETLPNALIFFPDGKPAIIYRYSPMMNNFISFHKLFQSSIKNTNLNFYNQAMDLITLHSAAAVIMKERFFMQILFSWLTTNASAHMKYSGLVNTLRGDLAIAPLNTILCSRMHELCDELALPGGLFDGDKNTTEFREYGHYTRNEFTAFGKRAGVANFRTEKMIDFIISKKQQALNLIDLAFLPDEAKKIFKFNFMERMARLS